MVTFVRRCMMPWLVLTVVATACSQPPAEPGGEVARVEVIGAGEEANGSTTSSIVPAESVVSDPTPAADDPDAETGAAATIADPGSGIIIRNVEEAEAYAVDALESEIRLIEAIANSEDDADRLVEVIEYRDQSLYDEDAVALALEGLDCHRGLVDDIAGAQGELSVLHEIQERQGFSLADDQWLVSVEATMVVTIGGSSSLPSDVGNTYVVNQRGIAYNNTYQNDSTRESACATYGEPIDGSDPYFNEIRTRIQELQPDTDATD